MKKSLLKRIIGCFLCFILVFAMLPVSVLAEGDPSIPQTQTPEAETPGAELTPAPAADPSEAPDAAPPAAQQSAQPVVFSVSFVVNGIADGSLQQMVETGATASRPANPPVPEGDEFAGQSFLYWYAASNVAYDFSAPVTADLVLYAKFGVIPETPSDAPAEAPGPILALSGILPDETPLWTYTFVVGDTTVSTQIVATNDTLDPPAVPDGGENTRFTGWYAPDGTLFTSFGVQTVAMTGSSALTARFEPAYYVFFYNQNGAIVETREPDASSAVSTEGVAGLQLAADEALVGWAASPGGTTPVGSSVTVNNANVSLYPIIENAVWITFESGGGTYVAPMRIPPETALTLSDVDAYVAANTGSSVISRAGYTFDGWSGFPFGDTPAGNVTLYANWLSEPVDYTVVYFLENADDDGYSYCYSSVLSGAAGSVIASVNLPVVPGFSYESDDLAQNNIISGSGKTIVTVLYKRNNYTVTFYASTGTSAPVLKTVTAKYGAYIGDQWPTDASGGRLPFYVSVYGGIMQMGLEIMPLDGASFWAVSQSGFNIYQMHYYVETLDPSAPYDVSYDGRYYILDHTDTMKTNGGLVSTPEDHYAISGFTYTDNVTYTNGRAPFGSNNELSFFYNRNCWSLQFYNFNAVDAVHSEADVPYQTDIGDRDYIPDRPVGLPDNYVFGGWYTTSGCVAGSEYIFGGKTMPNANLQLYAKWSPPTFSGTAH